MIPSTAVDERVASGSLSSPSYPHWRLGSVRVVLPGIEDADHRLSADEALPLEGAVTETLEENSSIEEIEILTYPGEDQQEHILTPKLVAERPESQQRPIKRGIRGLEDAAPSPHLERASRMLAERLAETLPEEIGIERCAVDIAGFGVSPAPVTRLVLQKNRETVASNHLRINPAAWTITECLAADMPHAIQTFVRHGSGIDKFLVSSRLVVFDSAAIPQSGREFVEMMDENRRRWDIGKVWRDAGLVSNRDLPIEDFWKPYRTYATPQERKYCERSDSYRARELFIGTAEWQEFKQGRSGYDDLYEKVLGYGRFPVTAAQLRLFAPLVPHYPDTDLWASASPRTAPRVDTVDVVRPAVGSEQSLGTGTDAAPPTPTTDVPNVGGESHQQLVSFALQYWREQGFEAWEIEQDTESRPDAEVVVGGETCAMEIECGNLSTPGNILTNKARAMQEGRPVIIVVNDEGDAKYVRSLLAEPYADEANDGVRLYSVGEKLVLPDGSTPVLPDGEQAATWILTRDGQLELRAAGRVLASGPADESVRSFEYACRRLHEQDGRYQLIGENGEMIDEAGDADTLIGNASRVNRPHVPVALHYLDDCEIRYKSGSELRTYSEPPEWDRTATGLRDRYRGGISAWARTYVVEEPEAELRYDRFRERFQSWYQCRLHESVFGKPPAVPDKKEVGRALPDSFDDKRREDDDKWRKYLVDVDWIFPPGIVSPDHPFVDAADDEE